MPRRRHHPKEVQAMRTFALLLAALTLSLGVCLQTGPAQAQPFSQTFVSGTGDNSNPCTRSSPCLTFAGAFNKTLPHGEINCLDSGPFGGMFINGSVTVRCTGVEGGSLVSSPTNGILIQAESTDVVVIEGLDFEGLAQGDNGIQIISAGSVTIRNCRIAGFGAASPSGNGIFVQNTNSMELLVVDSVIENNANAGVYLQPQTGSTNLLATINRVQINNNKFGVVADGTMTSGKINGTVRDSTVGNNSQNGITASATTASNDVLIVDNVSVIDNGNNGLAASGSTAGLLVSNSTIFGNAGGIHTANSASIVSYGNSRLNGNNGNDGAFTATIALH
jgi:Right handed beta helix region